MVKVRLLPSCLDIWLRPVEVKFIVCAKHLIWGRIPASLIALTIFLVLSFVTAIVVLDLSNFHSDTVSLNSSTRFALLCCSYMGWVCRTLLTMFHLGVIYWAATVVQLSLALDVHPSLMSATVHAFDTSWTKADISLFIKGWYYFLAKVWTGGYFMLGRNHR